LIDESRSVNVKILTGCHINKIDNQDCFRLITNNGQLSTSSLVLATGGLSIPKLGATNFGLRIAEQFGISIIPTRPGLVPLTFAVKDFSAFRSLSGISLEAEVLCNSISFREKILLTHRGLSGPAILQISSYWKEGDSITINLLPGVEIFSILKEQHHSSKHLATILDQFLPSRFVRAWREQHGSSKPMNQYTLGDLKTITDAITHWLIHPTGTEGYAKAEVTVGGVDTDEISSKTMEAKKVPGLYFIGEVVDVTGWLGGYNFQWAWSSGWAAGQAV
jgi:predicted Rossmann fold flavoprotein